MLPTNVMSFMKKMVNTEGVVGPGPDLETGTVLSKVRQTLSSSLMTAQNQVTRNLASTTRQQEASRGFPTTPPDSAAPLPKPDGSSFIKPSKIEVSSNAGACRVCLKSFREGDYSRVCFECSQQVCEDCASYYKQDANHDQDSWRCSICRRKMQSRAQPVVAQDSTDSLLDVPVLEALQRRHSDVKIGSAGLSAGGGSPGLAPPRAVEIRRHSDVSPASLKEIEKVKEKARERELEWHHKQGGGEGSPVGSRAPSPTVERRPFIDEGVLDDNETAGGEEGSLRRVSTVRGLPNPINGSRVRRKSRVQKQHSYDDEVKSTGTAIIVAADTGLGMPAQLPRRASAYDVFARGDSPAVATSPPSRRASFRAPPPPPPPPPTEAEEPSASSPLSPEGPPSLTVDEDRRNRRRGSQLPDLAAIARGPAPSARVAPRVTAEEHSPEVRRQASVQDGEAIQIIIHDVDYEPNIGTRPGTKRRVTLRRDPGDKAHRTRGFGMRVVGGKTGADGRLFAYIVWTVPGGPAEKGGLQQGDKVLEWGGMVLTDKSFEEVCTIMDRTGDVLELMVEHGMDLRMCDLLDEPIPTTVRKNSGEGLGLQLETETDKSPASPTRRKLPKTPV